MMSCWALFLNMSFLFFGQIPVHNEPFRSMLSNRTNIPRITNNKQIATQSLYILLNVSERLLMIENKCLLCNFFNHNLRWNIFHYKLALPGQKLSKSPFGYNLSSSVLHLAIHSPWNSTIQPVAKL